MKEYITFGFLVKSEMTKSCNDREYTDGIGLGSKFIIRFAIAGKDFPSNGTFNVNNSYNTQPSAHISLLVS